MSKKRRWLLVAAVVLAVGLGYIVSSPVIHSGADYFTVSGLKSQGDTLDSQQVRVSGKVLPGSIDWDGETKVLRFVLTDGKNSLNISHNGIAPDNFRPGVDLIVEGKYGPDGSFEALSFARRRSVCNFCH